MVSSQPVRHLQNKMESYLIVEKIRNQQHRTFMTGNSIDSLCSGKNRMLYSNIVWHDTLALKFDLFRNEEDSDEKI